jgi:hypothetical protein
MLTHHFLPKSELHHWVLAFVAVQVTWWLVSRKGSRQWAVFLVVEGEIWALLQAMTEAQRRGFVRGQFKSDLRVIAICTKHDHNSKFNLIVTDTINIIARYIMAFTIRFYMLVV